MRIGCVCLFMLVVVASGFGAPVRETRVFVDGATVRDLRSFDGVRIRPNKSCTDFDSEACPDLAVRLNGGYLTAKVQKGLFILIR